MCPSILVTVGSTQFPVLTDYIAQPHILTAIYNLGVKSITIQHGRAPFTTPPSSSSNPFPKITAFSYVGDLSESLSRSDIIISHAGAGTVSEAVAQKKRLLVVVNDALMHDHQMELANAMERRNCCVVLRGSQLDNKFLHCLEQAINMNPDKGDSPHKSKWALAAVLSQELGTI